MRPDQVLDEIADAILDGMPIDWSTVERDDPTGDRALVEQLKTLETLRRRRRTRDEHELPGTWNWGHLRVFERIGQGAYGDVYRAWDTRLDREVALKLLPLDDTGAGPSGSAVIEEGRLLARIRHPNVATIYGAERINGRVGLWMEFVKGRTLEEALRSGRAFTVAEVTRLGVELCHAVSAVHAAGLLHRDIKAQNVMLDDSSRLVLMDFGTGRELDETGEISRAADSRIEGTPLYLAPEVLSGEQATTQSDVYSIGVLLFRVLTNTYPVSGNDLADLRRAHAAGGDPNARVDRAEIPHRFRRLLARAIEPDPVRRYASTDELGAALAATEQAPFRRRAAWAAIPLVLVVALWGSWSLGLRELARPTLMALGVVTPTIVVLPFRNIGSDPGQDTFVDGLTTEVIRDLASLDGLQVTSQTSSFHFKDRPRDLRDLAKQLNVDLVVEARVQRVGNRLRITAQLARISGEVLWSEPYDRKLDDVFAIQDEISRAIVNKLRLTLGRGQRRYQTNFATYDLYLRGRKLAIQRGTKNAEEAAQVFAQVIGMDPAYAPAHAGLAEAYAAWSWDFTGLSAGAGLAAMRPAAEKAVELDPLLAEAHAAMGMTHARERNWENASASFEEALRLSPSSSQIRANYAISTLVPTGELGKAQRLMAAARVLDPLSSAILRDLGATQYYGRRYDDAIANLRHAFDIDPTTPFAVNLLARALIQAGRPEEAIEVFVSRPLPMPRPNGWDRWLMPAYVKVGRQQDIDRLLEEHTAAHPYQQAIIYAGLGDKDRTFEALGRAVDDSPQRAAQALRYPEMALLRGDPRLELLKKRLNLR